MGGFFNMNSPFYRFMSKLFDLMVLSLIWSACLVPVLVIIYFTESIIGLGAIGYALFLVLMVVGAALVGPASTALYYTVVKVIRRDRGYVTKEFIKSFKLNFRQALIVGVIITVFSSLLYLNLGYSKALESEFGNMLWYVYVAMIIFLSMISMYVFPVLSRYSVTIANLSKMSFFFSIRHFLTTVVSLICFLGAAFGCFITGGVALIILPSASCLLSSLLMEKVLKRYLPEEEVELNEDGEQIKKDEWFRE